MHHLRFQSPKQSDLIAQLRAGMQNLERCSEFCRRFVVSSRGELGHFAQSNCQNKKEKKPHAAADVSRDIAPTKPCDARNSEYDKRSNAPAMIRRTGTPCSRKNEK